MIPHNQIQCEISPAVKYGTLETTQSTDGDFIAFLIPCMGTNTEQEHNLVSRRSTNQVDDS